MTLHSEYHSAAEEQGLGPVLDLEGAELLQTGGWTMVVGFELPTGEYVTVIRDGSDDEPYLWVRHASREAYEAQEDDDAPYGYANLAGIRELV